MKKSAAIAVTGILCAALLSACSMSAAPAGQSLAANQEQSAAESDTETAENAQASGEMQTYTSGYGWSVKYDPAVFEMMESEESVSFYYLDESAGVNTVLITYVDSVQPEELLYNLTMAMTDDTESIIRSEGFFPGTDDKWCFRRVVPASEETSGLTDTLIAGEYNGAVLMFEVLSETTGDDSVDIPASDAVSELINSVTYDHFYDQEMFSYYPGSWQAENSEDGDLSVVLNKDHTGVLHLENDIDILWGSVELIPADGSDPYEYTVEGENLMLHLGDDWISFTKQEDSAASE